MLTNRITQWLDAAPTRITVMPEAGFVAVAMASLVPQDQWERVAAIYRAAAERVRVDFKQRMDPLPRFSLN